MVLTLVDVIIRLNEQDGDKMEGSAVSAHLTRIDADSTTGMVVPEISRGTADINGELTLPLWPNTLGKYNSKYLFTICQLSGKTTTYGPLTVPHLDENNQPITEIFLSDLDDITLDFSGTSTYSRAVIDAKDAATLAAANQYTDENSGAAAFDTVADMLAANGLVDGDLVRTLGYYNLDDGGHANYIMQTGNTGDGFGSFNIGGLTATLQHERVIRAHTFGFIGLTMSDNAYERYNALIRYVNSTGGGVDIVFEESGIIFLNEYSDYNLPEADIKYTMYMQVPNTRWFFNKTEVITKGDYHKTPEYPLVSPPQTNNPTQASLCGMQLWEADGTEIHDMYFDGQGYLTTASGDIDLIEWPNPMGKYRYTSGMGVAVFGGEDVLIKNCRVINATIDSYNCSRYGGIIWNENIAQGIKECQGQEPNHIKFQQCYAEYGQRGNFVLTGGMHTKLIDCEAQHAGESNGGGYGGVAVRSNYNFEYDSNVVPAEGFYEARIHLERCISKYPFLNHISGGEPARKGLGLVVKDCLILGGGDVRVGIPNTVWDNCDFDDGILRDGVQSPKGKLKFWLLGEGPQFAPAQSDKRTYTSMQNCRWNGAPSSFPCIYFNGLTDFQNSMDAMRVDNCDFTIIADPLNLPATAPPMYLFASENNHINKLNMSGTRMFYDPRFLRDLNNGGVNRIISLIRLANDNTFLPGSTFGDVSVQMYDSKGINFEYLVTNPNAWAMFHPDRWETYSYGPGIQLIPDTIPYDSMYTKGADKIQWADVDYNEGSWSSRPIQIINRTTDVGKTINIGDTLLTLRFTHSATQTLLFDFSMLYSDIPGGTHGHATIMGSGATSGVSINVINDSNGTIAGLFDFVPSGNDNNPQIQIKAKQQIVISSAISKSLALMVNYTNHNFITTKEL